VIDALAADKGRLGLKTSLERDFVITALPLGLYCAVNRPDNIHLLVGWLVGCCWREKFQKLVAAPIKMGKRAKKNREKQKQRQQEQRSGAHSDSGTPTLHHLRSTVQLNN